jgi:DNA polymerase (family 10)
MVFGDGRLTSRDGHDIPTFTEPDLYRRLELPFIPAELRAGEDEIAVAERGDVPHLIADMNIRGDLHMHSSWSDGRDTIEHMVLAGRQLGYEYVAITDHSERSSASRKMAASEIAAQRAEIDQLRAGVAGIEILHGVEVDIMPDGSLDFADHLLEQFDIVLASLHDHGGHDGAMLTSRYLSAIAHPLVNIITHPANRSPGYFPGYAVDFDRLFEAAAASGTAMEIDGAPGHLDLDGALARRAAAAGVMLTVDSDCHRADALARQMRWGLGTARRGWIEPRHVLNTRSADEVRRFVARKRARR